MHDNNGIVRCPKCKKDLIAEEAGLHECLASVKEIPVVFFYTLKKEKEGQEIVIAKGLDGVLYHLVKSINRSSSTTTTQNSTPKHDTPEDDRTILIIKKLLFLDRNLYYMRYYL